MSPEVYIVAGIIMGLLFTELTGLSPGGIIVPGYMAMFINQPLEIFLTVVAALCVMLVVKLASRLFFLFGRRRYVLCLLLGMLFKLAIERFSFVLPMLGGRTDIRLIGWLIPGIIANDMYKQGIPRTLLAACTVSALVYLVALGWAAW